MYALRLSLPMNASNYLAPHSPSLASKYSPLMNSNKLNLSSLRLSISINFEYLGSSSTCELFVFILKSSFLVTDSCFRKMQFSLITRYSPSGEFILYDIMSAISKSIATSSFSWNTTVSTPYTDLPFSRLPVELQSCCSGKSALTIE